VPLAWNRPRVNLRPLGIFSQPIADHRCSRCSKCRPQRSAPLHICLKDQNKATVNQILRTHWKGTCLDGGAGLSLSPCHNQSHTLPLPPTALPYSLHMRAHLRTPGLFDPFDPVSGEGATPKSLAPSTPYPIAFFSSKKHFKECINFIHCCRVNGGNCLVHW
jgi:hypothetical protein